MKSLVAVVRAYVGNRSSRSKLAILVRLLLVLFGLIAVYSVLFHVLMEREGQHHSWLTGFYWTLTVMSTLGFGDITFTSDLGRFFSVVVLVTGVMFLLVILPFTFIEFFYAPWMEAQNAGRTPRKLPEDTRDHVILTSYDAIATGLIPLLDKYRHPYVVLCPTVAEALELYDQGVKCAVGAFDDPETYRRLRLPQAAMLVASRSDVINTNITFTARELAEGVPIVATASSWEGRDVLELAGADLVLRLEETMGQALARRVIGKDCAAHVIGETRGLVIAEANVAGSELEGVTLAESGIRPRTGVSVIGFWDHGQLRTIDPQTVISRSSVLVLAGTKDQLKAYDRTFARPQAEQPHVIIIGGSRVGRLTASNLEDCGVSATIIEKVPEQAADLPDAVIGDATSMETLKKAGAREASTIIITGHDDDVNISLTIFFHRLRDSFQIITRCSLERNVGTLLRAGADLVLSWSSMGANTVLNMLREEDTLLLAEGVVVFPSVVPESMAGKPLADSALRTVAGCSVIAVEHDGERVVNPDPGMVIPAGGRLLLIGTLEAEERYLKAFRPGQR